MSRILAALVFALTALLPVGLARAADGPIPVAMAALDFSDTSGERADQSAVHHSRLRAVADGIRQRLDGSGRFRLIALNCGPSPCSALDPSLDLVAQARAAGARLLIFGGVHKMSTLVLNAKIEAIDINQNKLVFNRLITFRGDNDEAWARMEKFVGEELLNSLAIR